MLCSFRGWVLTRFGDFRRVSQHSCLGEASCIQEVPLPRDSTVCVQLATSGGCVGSGLITLGHSVHPSLGTTCENSLRMTLVSAITQLGANEGPDREQLGLCPAPGEHIIVKPTTLCSSLHCRNDRNGARGRPGASGWDTLQVGTFLCCAPFDHTAISRQLL